MMSPVFVGSLATVEHFDGTGPISMRIVFGRFRTALGIQVWLFRTSLGQSLRTGGWIFFSPLLRFPLITYFGWPRSHYCSVFF